MSLHRQPVGARSVYSRGSGRRAGSSSCKDGTELGEARAQLGICAGVLGAMTETDHGHVLLLGELLTTVHHRTNYLLDTHTHSACSLVLYQSHVAWSVSDHGHVLLLGELLTTVDYCMNYLLDTHTHSARGLVQHQSHVAWSVSDRLGFSQPILNEMSPIYSQRPWLRY